MPRNLLIAIDYDDTFTADPELWRTFIEYARGHGQRIVCITARQESDGQWYELTRALPKFVPIIFANGKSKRSAAEANGYIVDIWIDDYPHAIDNDQENYAPEQEAVEIEGE